jgi:hypothetical protein
MLPSFRLHLDDEVHLLVGMSPVAFRTVVVVLIYIVLCVSGVTGVLCVPCPSNSVMLTNKVLVVSTMVVVPGVPTGEL